MHLGAFEFDALTRNTIFVDIGKISAMEIDITSGQQGELFLNSVVAATNNYITASDAVPQLISDRLEN